MHICYLNMPIEYYSPISGGAVATVTMNQARLLIERGHRISVLTPVNDDPVYEWGEVIPLPVKRRHELSLVGRILSRVRRAAFAWDFEYYEYYLSSFSAALRNMKAAGNAPDVVIINNDLISSQHVREILPNARIIVWLQNENYTRRKSLQRTIAATDLFVAVSDYIRDWTQREYSVPDEKICVILNSADEKSFLPRDDWDDVCRDDSLPVRVLFAGRVEPNKSPELVADAVAKLRKEGRNVELGIAGGIWFYGHGDDMQDPYYRGVYEKIQRANGEMLGYKTRSEMVKIVPQYDVVCVLSRSQDPCPLVVSEAMASGCAVIASPRGGLPQLCFDPEVNQNAGLLADPDDLPAVVNALRSLVADRALLCEYKKRAMQRSRALTWTRNVDALERELQQLQ